jgi:hypothetical protein
MKECPFMNEAGYAWREFTFKRSQVFNGNACPEVTVFRVEMRYAMVVPIDGYGYSEKSADFRH